MIFHLVLGILSMLNLKLINYKLFMRSLLLKFSQCPQFFIKKGRNTREEIVSFSKRLFYNFLLRLLHLFLEHIEHNHNEFKQWLGFIIWYKTLNSYELKARIANEWRL